MLTLACPLRLFAAYIRFHIISPVIQQSAKKWVQAQMWPCANSVLFVFWQRGLLTFLFSNCFSLLLAQLSPPLLWFQSSLILLYYYFCPSLLSFAPLPCFYLSPRLALDGRRLSFTASIIVISLQLIHPSTPLLCFALLQCGPVRPAGEHPGPQPGRAGLWGWGGPAGVQTGGRRARPGRQSQRV